MARIAYPSVDAYIAAQPAAAQPVLERLRATLRKALPRATEGISYQIPVYKLDGEMVLYFAGFRRHYSIYPATDRLLEAMPQELADYLHNRATLRFSLTAPVPTRLITRIAKLRAAEAAERTLTKAAKKRPARRPTTKSPSRTKPAQPRAKKRR